jgi:hypothetical protein
MMMKPGRYRSVVLVYLVLLAMSLPIPILHQFFTDGVISTMRPMIRAEDGHWVTMLIPIHVLFLRCLGQLSRCIPIGVLALLIVSTRREIRTRWARRSDTICATAIIQCLFTTFYALYSTWLLGLQWMQWVQRVS